MPVRETPDSYLLLTEEGWEWLEVPKSSLPPEIDFRLVESEVLKMIERQRTLRFPYES
jgi:hypothetical protein